MDLSELDTLIEQRRQELHNLESARDTLSSVLNHKPAKAASEPTPRLGEHLDQVALHGLPTTDAVYEVLKTSRRALPTGAIIQLLRDAQYLNADTKSSRIYSAIYELTKKGRLSKTAKGYRPVRLESQAGG